MLWKLNCWQARKACADSCLSCTASATEPQPANQRGTLALSIAIPSLPHDFSLYKGRMFCLFIRASQNMQNELSSLILLTLTCSLSLCMFNTGKKMVWSDWSYKPPMTQACSPFNYTISLGVWGLFGGLGCFALCFLNHFTKWQLGKGYGILYNWLFLG